MKSNLLTALIVSAALAASFLLLGAEQKSGKSGSRQGGTLGINGTPAATMMNVNFVSAWYSATGEQERDPATGNSGVWYPRGTATAIYSAGLIWGGIFEDSLLPSLRVNGQSYNNGTRPGAIIGLRTGFTEDPTAPDVRIWRVRKNYARADLRRDAAEMFNGGNLTTVTAAQVQLCRDQYAKDRTEWPWEKGAPFYDTGYLDGTGLHVVGANNGEFDWGEDLNHNGILDPGEDANDNGQLDAEQPGYANADLVIWYVCNDIGVSFSPWDSPASGIEEQTTIWAYDRIDPIGHVIFKRFMLIYKGTDSTSANARITNMYIMQWSDPDLGDSGDDFAGCDTALGMSYVYNSRPVDANYASFKLVPPAVGYDLMQGPLVRGIAGQDLNKNRIDDAVDYGTRDLKRVGPGMINLPMTAAMHFAAGGMYYDPPFGNTGGLEWYQLLRGLPPQPPGPPDPPMVINPKTNKPTPFWLTGDPVKKTGWIDGVSEDPGDRRICLASGPFTMVLGDTQEIVSALVCGIGSDYLNSITVMKFNDRFVQTTFDSLLHMPGPPIAPRVEGYGINSDIILDWGVDPAAVARTESLIVINNYRFEGYKLYQFPNASGDTTGKKLLGQWDLKDGVTLIEQPVFDAPTGKTYIQPIQLGTDNGIVRATVLSYDQFRRTPFITGTAYHFAVTAYNYAPDEVNPFKTYESAPVLVTVIPEAPKPGTRYAYSVGDTVHVKDLVGKNSAQAYPVIYSPARQTGMTYLLSFDTTTTGAFRWSLTNAGTGRVIYKNNTDLGGKNITDVGGRTAYPVAESGFNLFVVAPPVGTESVVNEKGENVFGPNSSDPNYDVLTSNALLIDLQGLNAKTGTRYQIRFDGVGSYVIRNGQPPLVQTGAYRAPFSVWDIGRMDADTPRQVVAWVKWDKVPATLNVWSVDTAKVTIRGTQYTVFESITITNRQYPTGTADSAALEAIRNTINVIGTTAGDSRNAVYRILIRDKLGTGAYPPQGTVITFNKYLKLKAGDTKSVAPDANIIGDVQIARQDVAMIKAFPNPYYGLNRQETSRTGRFVTFNHLPTHAIIRVFTLAGQLVRRFEKHDATTQFQQWDLKNDWGLPVASGIYVVYIEMPELDATKTLKVAIIQEAEPARAY